MKKYLYISVIASFLFASCGEDEENSVAETTKPLKEAGAFSNSGGKVSLGEEITINYSIDWEQVDKASLNHNGKVLKEIKNSDANSFLFKTDGLLLGNHNFYLNLELKNGSKRSYTYSKEVLSRITPKQLETKIINTYPHNETSFTQGLEFSNGKLYEGTGAPDGDMFETKIMQIDLATGNALKEQNLSHQYFGEGITIIGDSIYQITYTSNMCYIYDKNTLERINEFSYAGMTEKYEGWGLTHISNDTLVMTDGTNNLYFVDKSNFSLIKKVPVYNNLRSVQKLNELEYFNGKIYANVWTTDLIVSINPNTGEVIEEIHADNLKLALTNSKYRAEVLNGIAYNKLDNKLYLTGKNWGSLFEVELIEQ